METVHIWHMVVANGSNSSFIMIFDESKKKKLSQTMSMKRKFDKVNALLRQRQNELITSLEAETQEIEESTFQLLNTTKKLPDRPLVVHKLRNSWQIVSHGTHLAMHFQSAARTANDHERIGERCHYLVHHCHLLGPSVCHFPAVCGVCAVQRNQPNLRAVIQCGQRRSEWDCILKRMAIKSELLAT